MENFKGHWSPKRRGYEPLYSLRAGEATEMKQGTNRSRSRALAHRFKGFICRILQDDKRDRCGQYRECHSIHRSQSPVRQDDFVRDVIIVAGYDLVLCNDVAHNVHARLDTGADDNIIGLSLVRFILSSVLDLDQCFKPTSRTSKVRSLSGHDLDVVGEFTVRWDTKLNPLRRYPLITFLVVDTPDAIDYPIFIGAKTLSEEGMVSVAPGPAGRTFHQGSKPSTIDHFPPRTSPPLIGTGRTIHAQGSRHKIGGVKKQERDHLLAEQKKKIEENILEKEEYERQKGAQQSSARQHNAN